MPELPDIDVFTRNLDKVFAGRKLVSIKIVDGRKLPDSAAAFTKALKGRTLKKIYRSGKEMRFSFTGTKLLGLHLMLTGDVFVFVGVNNHHSTIAELYFSGGKGLALTDRMKNANIRLSPQDKKGVDAISSGLNFSYLRNAFKSKAAIKKLLINQDIIRGIGNSYSDEILWQARISPYAIAAAVPDEKIKELVILIKRVLKNEVKQIYKNFPGKVNGEVKTYLQIHSKEKTKSPSGAKIIIDKNGMMKTYYTAEQINYTKIIR